MLPFIDLFGFQLPMYGLSIFFGIIVAAIFIYFDSKKRDTFWENTVIIGTVGVLLGFLGAKILFLLVTYSPKEILDIIKSGEIETILNSGFVFYGGLIFGVLGAFLAAKSLKEKVSDHENLLITIIPLVHAFGRLGCFFAGCCYGKPTNGIFSVTFQNPVSDAPIGVPLIPVQLYESAFNLLLFLTLAIIDKKTSGKKILLPIYVIAYGVERFIIEFFRYDEVRGIFFGLSTSQWISIAMVIVGVLVFVYRNKRAKNV